MKRKPTPPGEILKEFLIPLGITQKRLADHIRCDFKVVNRVVNEKAQDGHTLEFQQADFTG